MTHTFPTRRSSDLGDQMRHSHAGDAGHGADRVAVEQVQPDPEQGERPPETDGVDVVDRAARHAQSSSAGNRRSEEHTSELQSLMRISYAVFCLKKKILYFFTSFIFSSFLSS